MRLINAIGIGGALIRAKALGRRTPVNVMWRITNKCNSRCSYCDIWKREQKELDTEQILTMIDEMKVCGTQRIGFVGGEAFLRRDFEEIVDYVKSKGIYCTLVSNGCLVPKNLRVLKKLDYLVLSFDGKKKNHENGRMKGSFDIVMKAFRFCKRNKVKVLTNTVLNKHNLNDIDYILDTVSEYGFRCTFNVLQGGDCYPEPEEYRKVFDKLIKRKDEGAPIVLSKKAMRFLRGWPDYTNFMTKENIHGFKCWAGELIFNIDTDGKIAACDIMAHVKKNNPSCVEHGFSKAYKLVEKDGCKACTCAHVIEYNYMFSLKPQVIKDWTKLVFSK